MSKQKSPKPEILIIPTSYHQPEASTPHQTQEQKHAFAWVMGDHLQSFWDAIPFQTRFLSDMSTAEVDKDITDHKSKQLQENTFTESNRYIC